MDPRTADRSLSTSRSRLHHYKWDIDHTQLVLRLQLSWENGNRNCFSSSTLFVL